MIDHKMPSRKFIVFMVSLSAWKPRLLERGFLGGSPLPSPGIISEGASKKVEEDLGREGDLRVQREGRRHLHSQFE